MSKHHHWLCLSLCRGWVACRIRFYEFIYFPLDAATDACSHTTRHSRHSGHSRQCIYGIMAMRVFSVCVSVRLGGLWFKWKCVRPGLVKSHKYKKNRFTMCTRGVHEKREPATWTNRCCWPETSGAPNTPFVCCPLSIVYDQREHRGYTLRREWSTKGQTENNIYPQRRG